jgi:predicted tellurium resistance membrane protein TerC
MESLFTAQNLVSLATLTVLEIVLGIDNIIFISILAAKLPVAQQAFARQLGLALALVTRIALLFSIFWLTKLTAPLFSVFAHPFSGRDLILLIGGLFLIAKATHEIHNKLEGDEHERKGPARATLTSVVLQILILDVVFSLDSVITAVGMASQLWVMVTAVVIAVGVMLVSAGPVSAFIHRHPTLNMLALSFLLLVGVVLVADGVGHHIAKGYIYFAMAFSVGVEMLNMKLRGRTVPVQLRGPHGA